jgi:hypothetical protein
MILDILFKSYFVFFRKKLDRGIAAAVFVTTIPLGLNMVLILFYVLSLFVSLGDLGGIFLAFLITIIVFSTGMILRFIYITQERGKLISIRYPVGYYFLGFVHYFTSIILFISLFIALLDSGV